MSNFFFVWSFAIFKISSKQAEFHAVELFAISKSLLQTARKSKNFIGLHFKTKIELEILASNTQTIESFEMK